jgi:hypothetical protein
VLVLSGALAGSDRVVGDALGSYTFNYNGVVPEGASVRITALGVNRTAMDFTVRIDGLNKEQAATLVFQMLSFDLRPAPRMTQTSCDSMVVCFLFLSLTVMPFRLTLSPAPARSRMGAFARDSSFQTASSHCGKSFRLGRRGRPYAEPAKKS